MLLLPLVVSLSALACGDLPRGVVLSLLPASLVVPFSLPAVAAAAAAALAAAASSLQGGVGGGLALQHVPQVCCVYAVLLP